MNILASLWQFIAWPGGRVTPELSVGRDRYDNDSILRACAGDALKTFKLELCDIRVLSVNYELEFTDVSFILEQVISSLPSWLRKQDSLIHDLITTRSVSDIDSLTSIYERQGDE